MTEQLIGFAILIALVELREWHIRRKYDEMRDAIQGMTRDLADLQDANGVMRNHMAELISGHEASMELVRKTSVALEGLVNDYEIRLRTHHETPDYIRG